MMLLVIAIDPEEFNRVLEMMDKNKVVALIMHSVNDALETSFRLAELEICDMEAIN